VDAARLLLEERRKDAASRAAGAEDQEARATQRDSEVAHEVGDEADAVRVLAIELGGTPAHDRVDGARPLSAGGQVVHDLGRGRLVRQRHVRATAAFDEEVDDGVAEFVRHDVLHLVVDDVVELAREHAVDERRPAVSDRMAEQHEAARPGLGAHWLESPRSHAATRPA
jgi:hypothetical protein